MDAIWKFELAIDDVIKVRIPRGAEVLTVQLQNGIPCIWARVDTNEILEMRRFYWRGTGHDCERLGRARYVGTIQPAPLVFHLFDGGAE